MVTDLILTEKMPTDVENVVVGKPKSQSPAKSEKNVNTRRSLRNLQPTATDKENLVGGGMMPTPIKDHTKTISGTFEKRSLLDEQSNSSKSGEYRKKKLINKSVQTEEEKLVISAEDLTTKGTPSIKYWKSLANTKQASLEKVLVENSKLKEKIFILEEEVKNYKIMLSESEDLVSTLRELLDCPQDSEADTETQEDENVAESE